MVWGPKEKTDLYQMMGRAVQLMGNLRPQGLVGIQGVGQLVLPYNQALIWDKEQV